MNQLLLGLGLVVLVCAIAIMTSPEAGEYAESIIGAPLRSIR